MPEFSNYFLTAFKGFLFGFLASVPVGPINISIVNDGAVRGFRWAFLIGLGATIMEVIYCAFAFAGFAPLFDSRWVKATMELVSFLLMLGLGAKYLLARSLPATTRSVESFEHRLHPHTAFWTGFVRCLGNPGVLLFWITISAMFISHEWMADTWPSKGACVSGVAFGCLAWFTLLSFLAARGRGRFSTKTLLSMSHVSGATLLIVSLFIGARLVRLLAHR
ncbi:MAG TPA: LysE family transporter [Verrucomicrobiaceae bacterium]|jgi:threonine/homoserine/homoserine lactone efflux protein